MGEFWHIFAVVGFPPMIWRIRPKNPATLHLISTYCQTFIKSTVSTKIFQIKIFIYFLFLLFTYKNCAKVDFTVKISSLLPIFGNYPKIGFVASKTAKITIKITPNLIRNFCPLQTFKNCQFGGKSPCLVA